MTVPHLEVRANGRSQLVRLDDIREIVAMCETVPVDQPRDGVSAVVNLRGEIVPLLDLSTPADRATQRLILVCRDGEQGVYGLIVDEVLDLVLVDAPPGAGAGASPTFARVGDRVVQVLRRADTWDRRHEIVPRPPLPAGDAERRLLAERARRYAESGGHATSDRVEHVVFERGARHYAVPLTALREIRVLAGWTPIPGASPVAPGVIHFRGELLSLHDVGAFLDGASGPLGKADAAACRWLLIVEDASRRIGLLAEDVEGIVALARASIRRVPIALGTRAGCFAGVSDDERFVLDPAGLFDTKSFFLAA